MAFLLIPQANFNILLACEAGLMIKDAQRANPRKKQAKCLVLERFATGKWRWSNRWLKGGVGTA